MAYDEGLGYDPHEEIDKPVSEWPDELKTIVWVSGVR